MKFLPFSLPFCLLFFITKALAKKKNPTISLDGNTDYSKADGKDFFDAKCSACTSIVMELERNLELEQPKVNIDLRNTLRASGDQGKKVIPYEVS